MLGGSWRRWRGRVYVTLLLASTSCFGLTGCIVGRAPSTVTVTVNSPTSAPGDRAPVPAPTKLAAPTPTGPKTSISTGGTYLVGTDIGPGIYRTPGGSSCYWARLRSLDTSDIIDNHNSAGPQVVEILPTDRAFLTTCSTWTSDTSVGTTPSTVGTTAVNVPAQSNGQTGYGGLTCSYRVALTLRTAQSAVAICDEGTGAYTYKGLRLKDNARIDIVGAVPTSTGFTVTNAGTRYDVSRAGLVIDADGDAIAEVAIASGP